MATLNGTVYSYNGAYYWTWTSNTTTGDWVPATATATAGTAPPSAPSPTSDAPEVKAYVSCELAATDALKHFEQWNPSPYFHCKIAPGEKPNTSDTLYWAIVRVAPTRPKKFRLEGLQVGMRDADQTGVTFVVEGLVTE